MSKPTKADLFALASREISRGTTRAYDVVAEVGQIFDNVKHLRWVRDAVAEDIARNSKKYSHLVNSDGNLDGLSGTDCGCNFCNGTGRYKHPEEEGFVDGPRGRCGACQDKRKSSKRRSKKRSSRKSRK